MASISRRMAAVATVTVLPVVVALEWWIPPGPVRWLTPFWGILAIAVPWAASRALSRRVNDLLAYTREMPDSDVSRRPLQAGEDELGELARSLSRMATKMDQVVQGLSTELARREAILASMTDAVLAVDGRLNVSFCNEAFVRTAGHAIPEGVPLIKVLRDPGLFQILKHVIDSGETLRRRLSIPVQEDRWFEVSATPLAGAKARGALAILHDVTPMARVERMQRDFVANVSHEFRTPLATITGCSETLLGRAWDDERNRRKFLEIIHANSVRLTNIAADLITLSQLDTGGPRSEPEPIPVQDVVSSAMRAIEPVAGTRGVILQAAEICSARIVGHRLAFEQAMANLLDNAIKFSHPGAEVTVRASVAAGDRVEISVTDTGIGIPPEDLSRIFERFYRVDKARSRDVGGTGLGLSIVRQAIERMHGAIRVESQLGKGSCFTITLPRYNGAAAS
ncbi:MAG TPA: ATP-binding protein [Bryobacteraceae bacterium]|nr:ATP-binding protein [Bryobacteraceae bacterium]